MKCNNCSKEFVSKNICVCHQCSAMVCPECFDKSGGMCENCSGDMLYIQ